MASNTGFVSVTDPLIEARISAVAVCRSSASVSSRVPSIEQPPVLLRDHRLTGEGLDQLDLLVGERPHESAVHVEHPNRGSLAQERYSEHRAIAASLLNFNERVFRIG